MNESEEAADFDGFLIQLNIITSNFIFGRFFTNIDEREKVCEVKTEHRGKGCFKYTPLKNCSYFIQVHSATYK
jgi:hypothetical protein